MINHQEIELKIDNIITKLSGGAFEEDIDEVRSWKENVKRAFLTKGIKKHAGIQLIIQKFTSDLEDINFALVTATSAKLPDKERDRMLDKKRLYQDFLSLFPEAEQEIQAVETKVVENEEFLNLQDT